MRGRLGALALAALCLACGDGVVGRDTCRTAEECSAYQPDAGDALEIPFTRIDDASVLALELEEPPAPIACPSGACDAGVKLVRAKGDAVWLLPSDLREPLQKVEGGWRRTPVALPPPSGAADARPTFVSSDTYGRAVVHVDWPRAGLYQADGPRQSELLVIEEDGGLMARVPLTESVGLAGVVATAEGFLLYAGGARGGDRLVLLDRAGAPRWPRSPTLPASARKVGSAAAAVSEGFVVSAHPGVDREPSFGLLWLDASGAVVRRMTPAHTSWKSVSLLTLQAGAFALAAQSDATSAAGDPTAEGNLDVVTFGVEAEPVGIRLMRQCYYTMTVNGFSSDDAGNLYVATVTGDHDKPRGLLCQIRVRDVRCYETAPWVTLGEIVATDPGTLFVVANGELKRVRLPD